MVVKSVGAFSVGRVFALLQGVMGLIIGAVIALLATLGVMAAGDEAPQGVFAIVFGAGAVIIFPIFYAVIGFVGGVIGALIYNVVAGIVGGIELVLE